MSSGEISKSKTCALPIIRSFVTDLGSVIHPCQLTIAQKGKEHLLQSISNENLSNRFVIFLRNRNKSRILQSQTPRKWRIRYPHQPASQRVGRHTFKINP